MTAAALLAAGLLAVQSPEPRTFDVGPGPAPQSINRVAAQAGVDVVIAIDLSGRRTQALHGRMSADAALERLLRPISARAVRIRDGVYRIEAAYLRSRPSLRREPRVPEPLPTELSEVVVTAVPPVGLRGASGRTVVDPAALQRVEGQAASEAIADLSATVASTRQGTGRNKLFVRGLADSALNGPLQATIGQYLGDLRLSYGSPDPDLALIDIHRIEVFEGPQGTRFGVGAIGGILRLEPKSPTLDATYGRIVVGAGVTSGGAESGDASVIFNRPLDGRTAFRLVAYARLDGGFIDNPAQDRREADRVETVGGRIALRWTDETWTVDVTGVAQRIASADTQTIAVGESRFTKASLVAEPYESTFALAGVTAHREISHGRLSSATSFSHQRLDERFDASQSSESFPSLVDRRQTTLTAASELRVDLDPLAGWTWSGGAAIALGETRATRRRRILSPEPASAVGVDLERSFAEAAFFGEASVSPAPDWRVAIGARLSAVRIDTDILTVSTAARSASDRNGASVRVTPSLSARWDA
ncbi:MAG: TonB-dependent receptor, partial [Marmoricola sp.]|nr:TonB-dependent receptor [Marmoricola sp.]